MLLLYLTERFEVEAIIYGDYENNKGRDNWFTQWYTLADTKTNYWIGEDICINPELEGKSTHTTIKNTKTSKKT